MKKRNLYVWGMRILMWLAASITAALTLFLLLRAVLQQPLCWVWAEPLEKPWRL